ncbi:hypothetical protein AFE02nite_19960 [Actinotalea fermentans]|uniref:Uncharacterized protein n=1 Tax=Actinotalea fermentans TaxID=43671 RepID=A0A511YYJ3_9CELL|nr:hypothetical protein AFE02nite_19960 [Actinotalea fermentans]
MDRDQACWVAQHPSPAAPEADSPPQQPPASVVSLLQQSVTDPPGSSGAPDGRRHPVIPASAMRPEDCLTFYEGSLKPGPFWGGATAVIVPANMPIAQV